MTCCGYGAHSPMLFPAAVPTANGRARAAGEITRTFRTIPTIRTIRTRLRQAAPWQAAHTAKDGARGQGKIHYRSTVTPMVSQHTGNCGKQFPRGAGDSPLPVFRKRNFLFQNSPGLIKPVPEVAQVFHLFPVVIGTEVSALQGAPSIQTTAFQFAGNTFALVALSLATSSLLS